MENRFTKKCFYTKLFHSVRNIPCNKILLPLIFLFFLPRNAICQCVTPVLGEVYAITPTSASLYLGCSCTSGTLYLEYGPPGFTPGTGSSPGTGGTVFTFPITTNQYTITGLSPDTYYDVYMRTDCGSSFTSNCPKDSLKTLVNCGSQNITCDTMITANFNSGYGSFTMVCSNYGLYGRELIYSFTPAVSGKPVLFIPNSNYNHAFEFCYKNAAAGCSNTGWSCIGWGDPAFGTSQLSFGPLSADSTYYIAAVSEETVPRSINFRVECPYCTAPSNVTATNVTPGSAVINFTSSGYTILEYGASGFTPGTGATAGAGGTVINSYSNGETLTNLSSSSVYDVYLRSSCGLQFSPNSNKLQIVTAQCNTINYDSLGTWAFIYYSGRGYWDNYPGCYSGLYGQETFLLFTAPSTGYFRVEVLPPYLGMEYGLFTRPAGDCDISGFSCPSQYYDDVRQDYYYFIGPFDSASTYDLIFDVADSTIYSFGLGPDFNYVITCPQPTDITFSNIQSTSFNIAWSCNCATTYLEYGPTGFTPGTGATAGTNGTVIPNVTSPYTLSGLLLNTSYDIYLRSDCGGHFGANTAVASQRTSIDCSSAPVLSCGQDYFYAGSPHAPAWLQKSCLTYAEGLEEVFRFIPSQTGNYSVLVYKIQLGNTGYDNPAAIYIKSDSTCNEMGWTCAGSFVNNGASFTPDTVSLGNLVSGNNYLIMVQGVVVNEDVLNYYGYDFQLECPNFCLAPSSPSASSIGPYCPGSTIYLYSSVGAGTFPLTYSWEGPNGYTSSSQDSIISPAVLADSGTYTVTISNSCGSTSTTTHVTVNPAPAPPTVTDVDNCGNSALSTTATGSLLWSTGSESSSITVTAAGTYSVTTTVNGCSSPYGTALAAPRVIPSTPVVNVTNNCVTSTLSTISTGSLLWNTGATTSSITVITAGTYSVTATVNGCTSSSGTGTASPNSMSIPKVTDINNCGNSTLSTTATGNLLWNTGATTSYITVTAGGTYSVTVTVNSCTSVSGTAAAAPKAIPSAPSVTEVNSCGYSTLSTTSTGMLLWSPGSATTSSITVTNADTYSVTITLADGCSAIGTGSGSPLFIPPAPTVSVTNNCGNSVLSTAATGSLLWSTGATTTSITATIAGTYSVTQTVNGCTSPAGTGIATPKAIPSTPIVNDVDGCGSSALSTIATGSLSWSTGATTSSITVSNSNTYSVTVTAIDGCSATGSGSGSPLVILSAPSVSVTNNCGTALLSTTASGGALFWSTGATTSSITVTTAGTYSVTITGTDGCRTTNSVAVNINKQSPDCTISGNTSICISGSKDSSVEPARLCTPSVEGNSYLWSNGETTACITVRKGGSYSVTVITSGGCAGSCGVHVSVARMPSCSIRSYNGEHVTTVCGGPFDDFDTRFLWSTGATTRCIEVTVSGTYSLTETTGSGCSSTCDEAITVTDRWSSPDTTLTGDKYIYIDAYPNPFSDVATILIASSTYYSNVIIELYNITGQKIREIQSSVNANESVQVKINGSELENGLYIYRVVAGEESHYGRIILQKN